MNPEVALKLHVLVHGYGDYPRKRKGKPDISSSFQALAAAELWRQGKVEAFFLPTGAIDSGQPPIGEQIAKQLRRNIPHLPEAAIVAIPCTTTTRGEIREFKNIAQEKGWSKLADLCKEGQLRRARRAIKESFGRNSKEITVFTAESVLRTTNSRRYSQLLDRWENSSEEQAFRRREKLINIIDGVPFFSGALLEIANKLMGNKKLEIWVLKLLGKGQSNRNSP